MFLLAVTVTQLGLPLTSYALTSGPSQPEFSSFEPVTTSQMVDEFTGDFTYNIPVLSVPGPDGSDYPLALTYHSGATPEEESSWVGYGWSLNPGAINRNTRGFPDDFKGSSVKYWNRMPRNWTATVGVGTSVEAFSMDFAHVNAAIRYNNYQGFGYNMGIGVPLGKGVITLGYNVADSRGSFSLTVNPAAIANYKTEQHQEHETQERAAYVDKINKNRAMINRLGEKYANVNVLGGNHFGLSYGEAVRPVHVNGYSGASFNVSAGLQINPGPIPIGKALNLSGSYSWQKTVDEENAPAFGYLYSGDRNNQNGGADAVSDYYVEKETPYNKRDLFLGTPFNNADNFAVSGEGIGGSFRVYHNTVGEFAPNEKNSYTGMVNIAPEVSGGLAFGIGWDVGAGWQRLEESAWEKSEGTGANKRRRYSVGGAGTTFRFTNDLGGSWESSTGQSDEPVAGRITSGRELDKSPLENQLQHPNPAGSSSYISYHTKAQVYSTSQVRRLAAFSQRSDVAAQTSFADMTDDAICEMSVVTAAGGRFIYGLPLLSKQERNLQYGVQGDFTRSNHLVYTNKNESDASEMKIKVGEERATAYASSFLLTETRTPDYVDRTFDGPTADDLGGYTRFNYEKAYGGGTSGWYNWRMPYTGLLYQPNSLSDPMDDMGMVTSGKKEVAYLKSIQTKTHTAVFTLNSASAVREDGRDALDDIDAMKTNAENANASNRKPLRYLQRIDLYNNSDVVVGADGVATLIGTPAPIKTVHFEYTNELSRGVPNAATPSGTRSGKLTLKRIWYEYKGIPTKINPYSFSYQYPNYTAAATAYPSKYTQGRDNVTAGYSQFNTALGQAAQNPGYTFFNLDAWGNYQYNGATRHADMRSWVDQSQAPSENFDPAAWQLKVITLPSGGQIHVQYEQDDYAYVQDQPVHAMVSLKRISNPTNNPLLLPKNKFYLDLTSLGIAATDTEKMAATLAALRTQYPNNGGRKIFFKFLYNLTGTSEPIPEPCGNKDFIIGYVTVDNTGIDAQGIYIQLEQGGRDSYTLPYQVCKDFVLTQRAGKLQQSGGCDPTTNPINDNEPSPAKLVRNLVAWQKAVWAPSTLCETLNPNYSYFRIPLVTPKKGGGLRVKRLLTYDKGLEGEPVLYGSEYSYRMKDPKDGRMISSGVATTEPGGMREENILIDYLPRKSQGTFSKIIAGIDRKQTEGAMGESLLPAPSVGYARVVTRNIHSGRTATGYSVSEFATARKYPMQFKKTDIQQQTQFRAIYILVATEQVNNVWASQGFSFILNNMHGQVERKATYPGEYVSEAAERTASPSSEQVFGYYQPGKFLQDQPAQAAHTIPMITEQRGDTIALHPGREVDITSAQKAVKDNMVDLSLEFDTDIALMFGFPLPFATVFPSVTHTQAEFYTHTTSKVVRYPAVVKRIKSTQDGIVHISENRAFDRFTGQAVLVKSNDEFTGGYLEETVMASWVHPEFGPKAPRENINVPGSATLKIANGQTWLEFPAACDGLGLITRGDQLWVTPSAAVNENVLFYADAPDFATRRVRVYPWTLPQHGNDLPYVPADNQSVSMSITTSGRSNELTAQAGTTTYHGTNYQALALPVRNAVKHTSSTFTTDVNNWVQGLQSSQGGLIATGPINSYQLPGTYSGMNMSAYASKLQATCVVDPANVTISEVKVVSQLVGGANPVGGAQTTNNRIRVSIKSFKVSCPDGTKSTIQN